MTDIQIEDAALSQAGAGWFGDAPTNHAAPPVPTTPPTDPISTGVIAVIADWPAVHETLATTRSTRATHLLGANDATSANLTMDDTENAASITASAEG